MPDHACHIQSCPIVTAHIHTPTHANVPGYLFPPPVQSSPDPLPHDTQAPAPRTPLRCTYVVAGERCWSAPGHDGAHDLFTS